MEQKSVLKNWKFSFSRLVVRYKWRTPKSGLRLQEKNEEKWFLRIKTKPPTCAVPLFVGSVTDDTCLCEHKASFLYFDTQSGYQLLFKVEEHLQIVSTNMPISIIPSKVKMRWTKNERRETWKLLKQTRSDKLP